MQVGVFAVTQSGDIGGAGISRFAVSPGGSGPFTNTQLNAIAAALLAMYTSVKSILPLNMLFTVAPTVQMVEDTTHGLVGQENIPTTGNVTGQTASSYMAGMGARMYWHTNQVRHGRLVRGATYMTPLSNSAMNSNGALTASAATQVAAAGNAYIAALNAASTPPMVLCRPTTKGGSDGTSVIISACTVSTKPAGMRSRRS